MRRLLVFLLFSLTVQLAAPASAQDREVPYWATLRATEVNMRVGPSEAYPIAWVYRRQGLPVKVLRVREGWRLVQDPDGERECPDGEGKAMQPLRSSRQSLARLVDHEREP